MVNFFFTREPGFSTLVALVHNPNQQATLKHSGIHIIRLLAVHPDMDDSSGLGRDLIGGVEGVSLIQVTFFVTFFVSTV